ncbi:hypothetical protein [Variovorax sp. PAMC28562]|uniref:hypothetical protein n=1 Tax=Variovorax sp. PAMC28562 TaxID=2762323 RepID=UPI001C9A9116|nr:hypothetical protein [Variovorax sp. PAMC28562]
MTYMNTERDNFHDWARDKPDHSKFTPLSRADFVQARSHGGLPWGRIVAAILICAFIVYVIKLLIKH